MLIRQLERFGLDQHFAYQGKEYQARMARDLRPLVFRYLEGGLKDIHGNPVEDGPAVKRLRKYIDVIGGKEKFIKTQSPDQAWATDIELTLLAELLRVNFIVEYAGPQYINRPRTVLSAVEMPDQPVVVLANSNNTKWDAVLDGEIDQTTLHDNNCGYNAFAKSIAACCGQLQQIAGNRAEENLEIKIVKQSQDAHYLRAIEEYKKEAEHFQTVHKNLEKNDPQKYKETMEQIDKDYQYALKVALDNLPGVYGKISSSVVPFSILAPKKAAPASSPTNSSSPGLKSR